MLLNDEENGTPPAFPAVLVVATTLAGALFVYLAFHAMRGGRALGLEGQPLRAAVSVALVAFFVLLAYGGWRARRDRQRL